MLRLSVVNESATLRLKMEGKLAHEWVQEALNAWTALTQITGTNAIVVDLCNVSFVDDAGHQLLARMRHAGADLVGYGPMISALLEEIERTEASEDSTSKQKGRGRLKAMKVAERT